MDEEKLNNIFGTDNKQSEPKEVKETIVEEKTNEEEPVEEKLQDETKETITEEVLVEDYVEPEQPVEEPVEEKPVEDKTFLNTETKVEEESDSTGIISDDQGYKITMSEEVVEDTDKPVDVVKGIFSYPNLNDDLLNNPLLFGQSDLKIGKVDPSADPLELMKHFRNYGSYIDIFLPVSNIAVRVYEFDIDAYLENSLQALRSFSMEVQLLQNMQYMTITKKLLAQIKDNCVFLCKNGDTMTDMINFDDLSKQDINFLLLGTATLLCYVNNEKKSYNYDMKAPCTNETCDAIIELNNIDLLKLFKQQYEGLPSNLQAQIKIDNYNVNETFNEKLSKSLHNKRIKLTCKKEDNNGSINMVAIVKDPSYGSYKQLEDTLYRYILNKYATILAPFVNDIPSYNLLSNTRKMGIIANILQNEDMDAIEDIQDIFIDFTNAQIVPWIDKLEITINNSPTTVVDLSTETPGNQIQYVKNLPTSLIKQLVKVIDKVIKSGVKDITLDTKCPKCGIETKSSVPAVSFFFSVMNTLLEDLK